MKNEESSISPFSVLHSSFSDSLPARHNLIGLERRLGYSWTNDDVAAKLGAAGDARAPPNQRQAGVQPLRRGLVRRVVLAVADPCICANERLLVENTAIDHRAGLDDRISQQD